ncbi:MAG: GtrA family protein [Pirellulaceae bacterium]|nr:GtrA family protein [Pirellulaceae bacterium]
MSSFDSLEALAPTEGEPLVDRQAAARLSGEVGRSLVVSAIALVVDYFLMVALHEGAGIYHLLAAAGGFFAGLATNYALSVAWVFQSRSVGNRWLEFAIFAAIGLAGLGLTLAIQFVGTDLFGGPYWLVRLVAVALVFAWNFGLRKVALFRAGPAT